MARSPKPKDAQADGVLDAAAPVVADPVAVDPTGWALRVRALQPSRWRAGRHFGPEPVEIAVTDLTADQVVALRDDPQLAIALVAPDGTVEAVA